MVSHTAGYPSNITTKRLRRARLVTFVGFFQLGVQLFLWATSTSALRAHLGWEGAAGDLYFGALLLTLGIAAAVGAFAIGPIIDRYGVRRTVAVTLVAHPLLLIPLGYVSGLVGAVISTALLGLSRGAHDTGINAHGVEVQRHYKRSIMALFHAAYSAGGFAVGWIGSYLAQRFTESPAVGFTTFGILLALVGLLCVRWLLAPHEIARDEPHPAATASAPSRRSLAMLALVVGFGFLLLTSMLSEFAIANWAAVFTERVVGTTAGMAAMAITVYTGAQFVGRLVVDKIVRRYGDTRVVTGSGLLAALGLGVVAVSENAPTAFVGFVLAGLGLACMAPLMLSAAGRLDQANAGRNIGLVELMGYSGPIIGPIVITSVVTSVSMAWMPAIPAALLLLLAAAAPFLLRRSAGYDERTEDVKRPETADPSNTAQPR